jgi:hypothetical protein
MKRVTEPLFLLLKKAIERLFHLFLGLTRWIRRIHRSFPFGGPAPVVQLYGEELPTEIATIVYVIDSSCSMDSQWQTFTDEYGNNASGYRIDRAKSEVIAAINELSDDFMFDVLEFTCTWSLCFGGLEDADEGNKEFARDFVNSLKLNPKGATATGPCVAWALQHYESRVFILVTDGDPNVLKSGSGRVDWQTHALMIREANTEGATIHVIAISPTSEQMIEFNRTVTAQNGPGQVWVVGEDAIMEPQPREGLN